MQTQKPEASQWQDKKILDKSKELITREIKLCKTLRAMISRELEAIVLNGDMDELLSVLEKKSEIISQLQLLADGWRDLLANPVINNFSGSGNFRTHLLELYPDDSELGDLIQESQDLATSIVQAEDEAVEELEKYRAGLRSQMATRARGKNAAASYARMGGSII
ncbi:MAG: hypothetical protein IJR94_08060 [Synergistaceae bacterium]|nr:hypothetical protein [Synergistaceae bacterium]